MRNLFWDLIWDFYTLFVGHRLTFLMGHFYREFVTVGFGDIVTFLYICR